MNHRDPKPEIYRIENLVSAVKEGEILLPKFQRPFVWKRKEVLKLLDSIYKGYPIGSILLWHTSEKLASERTIADIEVSDTRGYPVNYLLDGQQRLSSLCGALYWNGKALDSIWNISFDLEKEEFIFPKEESKIELFPLNKLLNTSDFINKCKSFEAHSNRDLLFKNAEKLLRSIKDYKIAAVKIGDMTISEVAPIFERINSSGRKLTIVDLMRAATWKGDFDLNDSIEAVREICSQFGFIEIPESHILRNISACAGLGINREDIDKLRSKSSSELMSASAKCSKAYIGALTFLKDNFPIQNYDFLPYGLQLTLLAEFFNLQPEPSNIQIGKLKNWFWTTAFARHFGRSNTGQNTRDLINIRKFALGESDSIPIESEIFIDKFLLDDFRLNIATSKSFALLLASNKPKSILTGKEIALDHILFRSNRANFFHLVPMALFPENDLNKLVNICLLGKNDQLGILGQRPSIYIKDLIDKHGESIEEILYSNFLNRICLDALLRNDINAFFEERKLLLKDAIEHLSGTITTQSKVELIVDEDDDLEDI